MRYFLFLYLIGLAGGSGRTLWWTHSTRWLDVKNWSRQRAPCSTDTVLLPRWLSLEVALPGGLRQELKELVLPGDGGLVLGHQTQLVLSSADRIDGACPGQENAWLVSEPGDWTDPANWGGTDAATPDLERIPCPSDTVQLDREDTDVRVPPVGVQVAGIVFTKLGHSGRKEIEGTSVRGRYEFLEGEVWASGEECEERSGCECPAVPMLRLVCERRTCPQPACLQPVKPLGDCCNKCGAYLLFGFSEKTSLSAVQDMVRMQVGEEAVWHVSRTMGFIQVVLSPGQGGKDLETVANSLSDFLLSTGKLGLSKRTLALSGPSYSPSTTSSPFFLFFFSLTLAASAFAATFYYFEKGRWRWFGGSRLTFARFENLSGLVEIRSTPRPSLVMRLPKEARGFDNPLYSQERGGSVGQESLLEEEKSESSSDSDTSFDRKTVTTLAATDVLDDVPIGKLID